MVLATQNQIRLKGAGRRLADPVLTHIAGISENTSKLQYYG
jgi:hypothetical protein